MQSFKSWLMALATELVKNYGYTEKQAREYVIDQPEAWRDLFDDDYTPEDAAYEDAIS